MAPHVDREQEAVSKIYDREPGPSSTRLQEEEEEEAEDRPLMEQFGIDDSGTMAQQPPGQMGATGPLWWIKQVSHLQEKVIVLLAAADSLYIGYSSSLYR